MDPIWGGGRSESSYMLSAYQPSIVKHPKWFVDGIANIKPVDVFSSVFRNSKKAILYHLATISDAAKLTRTGLLEQGEGTFCSGTFFSAILQLIPCKAAVAPFSPFPPSESCCNAIKAVGQPCLCLLVKGPPISGVDRNMVLQLPEKCAANFEPCDIMQ
ncbi:hypothetical protein PTKIN_Ptkin15bG0001500 [Pterospermum kingtungense]